MCDRPSLSVPVEERRGCSPWAGRRCAIDPYGALFGAGALFVTAHGLRGWHAGWVHEFRFTRQSVSLSEDVEEHVQVERFDADALLGDVVARLADGGFLLRMVGSTWTFELIPPEQAGRAAVMPAIVIQRALGVTQVAALQLPWLSRPLRELGEWKHPDGLFAAHSSYGSAGAPRSLRRFGRLLRR